MSPRLLLCDVDGTIVSANGVAAPSLPRLYEVVKECGGLVALATSRPPQDVLHLTADECPQFILAFDGALLAKNVRGILQPIHERFLSGPTARMAIELVIANGFNALAFEGSGDAFVVNVVAPLEPHGEILESHSPEVLCGRPRRDVPNSDARSLSAPIRSVAACERFHDLAELAAALRQVEWPESVSILYYEETRFGDGLGWVDVATEATKATALWDLIQHVGGNRQEWDVVALGNGNNDVAMFTASDHSECPSDGSEAARRSASRVVETAGGEPFIQSAIESISRRWGQ